MKQIVVSPPQELVATVDLKDAQGEEIVPNFMSLIILSE
jgi:hypothetical protein